MGKQLSRERQIEVLHLLLEGNSIRSTERLTDIHRDTIMRVLVRFGERCQRFLDKSFANLSLRHIQVDEIWTYCKKKQARLTAEEKKDDTTIGDQYVFLALDTDTKLLVNYIVGKRTSENAYALMADLERRLVRPPQGDHERQKPQISTDGFPGYPAAVAMNFGNTATHGILIKEYVDPESGRYAPPKLMCAKRINANGISNPRTICTSHIERCNLSIRTFIRRFTRLSLGFSKKVENLSAAVAAHLAHYNFCRIHGTLRCTPAMSAKVTGKLWGLPELFDAVNEMEERRTKAVKVQRLLERMRSVLG